ncbi:cuticle protein 16.5-like [Schistocerca americana]|uniref:cuticle protein 16.5-like n=1 Tax=Schistocerca americana TaxID=7009 RepID=UPI001F4FABB5|nr:cuticle protein 16.5-like [Schistocerca americana]
MFKTVFVVLALTAACLASPAPKPAPGLLSASYVAAGPVAYSAPAVAAAPVAYTAAAYPAAYAAAYSAYPAARAVYYG